jgi:xanthine/CO dehydrogenase XdhC/CoxF family maturation factor
MKEIKAILKAYDRAVENKEQTALATVVKVDGSSYRQPGARMLVTENGELTGAVSGGCLEGDALKKAQMVIFKQQAMLVTYDTTDEDDAKFGVGLGCNGIIHILIEPILENDKSNPILLLKACLKNRAYKVLVTIFDRKNKRIDQPGTLLLNSGEDVPPNKKFKLLNDQIKETVTKESKKALATHESVILQVNNSGIYAFVESIAPAIKLNILGAGNDVIPLVKMAAVMGWEITIGDGRSELVNSNRFPEAEELFSGKADEVAELLQQDNRTAVLLMTHNFNYDLAILKALFPYKLPYFGVLGPKKKLSKLKEQLLKNGIDIDKKEEAIFGPMGLDIGAESPEEIALSIIAEIKAVIAGSKVDHLKLKNGPIHDRSN